MQLPNPQRKHSKVINGVIHNYDEARKQRVVKYVPIDPQRPQRGVKEVESFEDVPIDADLVNAETGEDLTKYWQPETVLDPSNCMHDFKVTNMGKREVECDLCHWALSFNAGTNYIEEEGKSFIVIKKKKYEITSL